HLLGFTVLLGTGHMFLMAAQLTVRSANLRGRDVAFGHFMVAVSVGQGLGPFIVGFMGGSAAVPQTGPLFAAGLISALPCLVIAFAIRPMTRKELSINFLAVPIAELMRRPGMLAVLIASVVTVTAGDLLVIYLPLLGAERSIDASHIGMLLLVRSLAALV